MTHDFVLTVSCRDRPGIVHAVSGVLADRGCNIVDSQQYGSTASATFFLRMRFSSTLAVEDLRTGLASTAAAFEMTWQLHDSDSQPALLIMVSRHGHCLNDLLYRWRSGNLPGQIVAVGSNHRDLEALTESYDVPFHHLPVTPQTRAAQERGVLELVESSGAELVVLARYMQVLTPTLCDALARRVINIHHSFLPSFPGGRPYEQAFARGVKLIGATAHYVTPDLDNGPIIEQEVARVGHQHQPAELAAIGRDLECSALARAVRWHLEHRVLLDGNRTVVFP
jgi:formyltetrahydrofolate deformylase